MPSRAAAEDEAAFSQSKEDALWHQLAREVAPHRIEGHYYFVVQRYFRDSSSLPTGCIGS